MVFFKCAKCQHSLRRFNYKNIWQILDSNGLRFNCRNCGLRYESLFLFRMAIILIGFIPTIIFFHFIGKAGLGNFRYVFDAIVMISYFVIISAVNPLKPVNGKKYD